jgi:ferric-dicitrate binding protein FerR (iron transport regulator)
MRTAVSAEWQGAVASERRPVGGQRWQLAAAALAVCAVAIWLTVGQGAGGELVGIVQTQADPGLVAERRLLGGKRLEAGASVRAGQHLEAEATTLVALAGGGKLFIRQGAAVTVNSAHELALRRGSVYIDMDPALAHGQLQVRTPYGLVQHVGTQFEVSLLDGRELVSVREGTVQLSGSTGIATSIAQGREVTVTPSGIAGTRAVLPYDARWQWTEVAGDTLAIDGKTVTVLLRWVARTTGRELVFDDARARKLAEQTVLHGTIRNLSPALAMRAVLATTSLSANLGAATIRVTAAAPAGRGP